MKNLINNFKKLISKIYLYSKIYSNCIWVNNFIKKNLITTVLDIGVNTGHYSSSLRRFGYTKKIISFEPGIIAYSQLLVNSKNDKNWKIYERAGLGNKKKSLILHVSKNSVSSSFKMINKIHIKHEPKSRFISSNKCKMIKLDDIFKNIYKRNENIMLKIDTQGFDWEVIRGSKVSLKFIKIIQVELSFIELYKNQNNWLNIIKYLEKNQFKVCKIIEGFKNKKNNQVFQSDFFFINKRYHK